MSSCSKQIGGGEARIEAREALELDRLDNMTENELYDELLSKYQNSYGDRGKAIERLNKMENRGKDEYIKEILEFDTLYNRARRFLTSGARKKKPKGSKGSKKKKHKKKGSKGSKKKAKKATKQGGGKSRKPKKANQTRKRPTKSRSRRPKKMKRSKRAGVGGNPFPLMFSRSDAYDTYGK